MEIVQHRLDRSVSELGEGKQTLEQRLNEEKAASGAILDYLDKHYNVTTHSV